MLTSYFFPEFPASAYLGNNLRERICEVGDSIELFVPVPSRGVDKSTRKEYKHRKSEYMYNGKLHITRFPMISEGKNPFQRAFRYSLCWLVHFWKGLTISDIDCIFLASTPPIQGVLGGLLKQIKKVPFVYNLQDIFPDSLAGTGLAKKGGLLWKIGRVIENFTYRNADKIIVISEDFKRNIMAKGVPEEKIVVVYNWVDEEAVKHVPREENVLFDRYGLDRSKFYITYCGNIGLTQNLQMLTEVAKEMEVKEDIQFVLVGNGAYKEELERIIQDKQIKNITLLPFQPYEEISHVFSLGDVSLVISKPGVGENSVPSKTWSILSASRPVLANFDENELKTIVDENQCGIFTKAGDKDAFKQAIMDLYNDRERCKQLGENGREFILKNLTRAVGTQKYVDVIKSFDKSNDNTTFIPAPDPRAFDGGDMLRKKR